MKCIVKTARGKRCSKNAISITLPFCTAHLTAHLSSKIKDIEQSREYKRNKK